MQPDQHLQQALPPQMPPYMPPPKRGVNVFGISMTVVSLLLLCVLAGVGYYAYTLNTNLTNTSAALNSLQAEHDKLKADYAALQGENGRLNSDIAALQSELDKAKNDLTTAQTDLKTAQDQGTALQAKIDAALLRLNVLVGFWIENKNDKGLEADIRETRDTKLLDLFQAWISSSDSEALGKFDDFFSYLVQSIVDELE